MVRRVGKKQIPLQAKSNCSTRTSSVVMHPTKIGTVLIPDGNECKTVSAFIPRPVLKNRRAILVSNVPSGTWVGVQKLPRGRAKGRGGWEKAPPSPYYYNPR